MKNAQEDFPLEEQENAAEILQELATKASEIAIAEDKALGLPITYLKDGKVIKEFPDGRIVVIEELEKTKNRLDSK